MAVKKYIEKQITSKGTLPMYKLHTISTQIKKILTYVYMLYSIFQEFHPFLNKFLKYNFVFCITNTDFFTHLFSIPSKALHSIFLSYKLKVQENLA